MRIERYRLYEKYMLECMGDSAHDAGHVYRVLYSALALSEAEKDVDVDVLIAAALLHDVGREAQFRTGENHALAGARMARAFLIEQGEGTAFADRVADCVRTHRFRSDDPPVSTEAKLIFDADKLDVSGTIGLARTLLYQGRMRQPIYSVGPDGEILSGEEKTPSLYSEYRHKLQGIGSRFLTCEGARRAKRWQETADSFFRALQAEAAAGEAGAAWRLLPRSADARQRRILNLALMLSEGVDRRIRDQVIGIAARQEADDSSAGRYIRAAAALDDLGALGVAQRLMKMGAMGKTLDALFDEAWIRPELPTAQAREIARVRAGTTEAFLNALRREMDEGRGEGQEILRRILE